MHYNIHIIPIRVASKKLCTLLDANQTLLNNRSKYGTHDFSTSGENKTLKFSS